MYRSDPLQNRCTRSLTDVTRRLGVPPWLAALLLSRCVEGLRAYSELHPLTQERPGSRS
jgi:hypothetical protein